MNGIGWAVKQMNLGLNVCRSGWNGKRMYLFLVSGSKAGAFSVEPYVLMKTAQDKYVPWLCSQSDLLATDWEIADGVDSKAQRSHQIR